MLLTQQENLGKVANFFNADYMSIVHLETSRMIHSYSQEWDETYSKEQLWEDDPVQQIAINRDRFIWGDSCYGNNCLSLARDFGIKSGLTLKMLTPNCNEYLITLASSEKIDDFLKCLNVDHLYSLSSMSLLLDLSHFEKEDGHFHFLKYFEYHVQNSSAIRNNMHETFEILESMQTEIDFLIPFRFKDNLDMFNKAALKKTKTPLASSEIEYSI